MVGDGDKEVTAWLQGRGFTNPEAGRIIEFAKREEGDARTLWQLVNGGTALARAMRHADTRVAFERRMSRLLAA